MNQDRNVLPIINLLLEEAEKRAADAPFLVVWIFYDFLLTIRHRQSSRQVFDILQAKMPAYLALLRESRLLETTPISAPNNDGGRRDVKDETAGLYGRLWSRFELDRQMEFCTKALQARIEQNGFPLASLKGKRVIDIGCGSGRFSCALALLEPDQVVAVDWGDQGLAIGASLADQLGLKNIQFQKASIIDLPFADQTFDFAFANGVFHHTEDLLKGIREQYRILKSGGTAWLYLYGSGGIYWPARKGMRRVMATISETYARTVLDLLGGDPNWFTPLDIWFVPIEEHTSAATLEPFLFELGYRSVNRCRYGLPGDQSPDLLEAEAEGATVFGEGELRYLLTKGES